jgi:HlyD family secretion protein
MDIKATLTRPRTWAYLGIALLAALVLYRCTAKRETAPQYETAAVDRGDVIARVSASGSLSAVVTVEVGSQVSGRIQSLHADFNSVVKRGQLIAKIDPSLFEAAVAQAAANVAASRGNLERLRVQAEEAARQARRSTQLFDQKLISETDRDNAVSNSRAAAASVMQAQGQLDQALASLRQAQTNLRYTDILAPTDGIVISRAVNVGQTVAASLQAPVIFTIAQDLRAMEVHTNVAESDIGRLRAGMEAGFTVDAYPGERFVGRIREIRNAPQVVQNVVTYDAVIDVANPELKLKPGMTATVTVIAEERKGVLRVPNAALRFRPESADAAASGRAAAGGGAGAGGGSGGGAGSAAGAESRGNGARTVWVQAKGDLQPREVRTGLADSRYTEITSGQLAAGDTVVVGTVGGAATPPRGMRGGMRIL